MLAHILSILGIVLYAHEVYRTVRNFGVRRGGMVGGAVELPVAHIAMAVLLGCVGFFGLGRLAVVPAYVGPAILFISTFYFGSAVLYRRRRAEKRRRGQRGES